MVAIGSATPLPVFPYVKDVGKSGLGTLREKSTWATRQEVDGPPAPEPAAVSALVGHRTAGPDARLRRCGRISRRNGLPSRGAAPPKAAERLSPGDQRTVSTRSLSGGWYGQPNAQLARDEKK